MCIPQHNMPGSPMRMDASMRQQHGDALIPTPKQCSGSARKHSAALTDEGRVHGSCGVGGGHLALLHCHFTSMKFKLVCKPVHKVARGSSPTDSKWQAHDARHLVRQQQHLLPLITSWLSSS
jgi:hypothetical protein